MRHLGLSLAVTTALTLAAAHAEAACERPTSPTGYLVAPYGDAEVRTLDGPRVRVHYTLEGLHAVTAASPGPSGAPIAAEAVRDSAEAAFTAFENWGYPRPLADKSGSHCEAGGDDRFDIYMVHFPAADGHVGVESCRSAGVHLRCTGFMLVARDYERRYGDLQRGVDTVVPHEAFHAVQHAMDANLPSFFAEGGAQWAANRLRPELNDLESYFEYYFASPETPLDSQGAAGFSAWNYAAALWSVFLAERHDADLLREILDTDVSFDDPLAPFDAALGARGSSLADGFVEFATWNAATGSRWSGAGYEEGADYPEVALQGFDGESVSGALTSLSARYYRLRAQGHLRLDLDEGDRDRLGVGVLRLDADGRLEGEPLPSELPLELAPGDYVLVVASRTASKRDNRFTLRTTVIEPPASSPSPSDAEPGEGGCSAGPTTPRADGLLTGVGFLACLATLRRTRKARS